MDILYKQTLERMDPNALVYSLDTVYWLDVYVDTCIHFNRKPESLYTCLNRYYRFSAKVALKARHVAVSTVEEWLPAMKFILDSTIHTPTSVSPWLNPVIEQTIQRALKEEKLLRGVLQYLGETR